MKNKLFKCVLGIFAAALSACGGGSNNDQGMVLSADRFISPDENTCPASESALGQTAAALTNAFEFGCLGLRNNSGSFGLRLDTLEYTFHMPQGSQVADYSTSTTTSGVFGPNPTSQAGGGSGSTLPAGFGNNTVFLSTPFYIAPTDFYNYLLENKGNLPDFPFTITLEIAASGVSTAGDRFTSNSLFLPISVYDEAF